jgi:hypothetical protein
VFEKRVLRKTFGLRMVEVTASEIKLHNEELHDCTPEGKRQLGRPSR